MATRTIHTGLYGSEAFHILDAVWTDVLDEYGDKRNTERTKSVIHTSVEQADDNEVVFECESIWKYGYKSAFSSWNDKRVLDHIAWELKRMLAKTVQRNGDEFMKVWMRSRTVQYNYVFAKRNAKHMHGVTVSKLYFIYDKLRGRKTEKRYPAKYVNELVAMPLDPIMTEMKIAQKEEIKKIEEALTEQLRKLKSESYAESEKARIAVVKKYEKIMEDAKVETARKIDALKKEMDSFGNAAALLLGQ